MASVITLVLIAGVWTIFWREEPSYQDKSLSEWLRSLDKSPITFTVDGRANTVTAAPDHAATQAFSNLGTNAVPLLIRELKSRDSRGKLWLMTVLKKQSFLRIDLPPAKLRHRRAVMACAVLGPQASPALPELTKLLDQGSADLTLLPRTLAMIGPEALPSIMIALTNKGAQIRWLTAGAMRQVSFDASMAVPRLVDCLSDPEANVRCEATMAVGHIRKRPDLVTPALKRNLNDSNSTVRAFSAEVLKQFETTSIP